MLYVVLMVGSRSGWDFIKFAWYSGRLSDPSRSSGADKDDIVLAFVSLEELENLSGCGEVFAPGEILRGVLATFLHVIPITMSTIVSSRPPIAAATIINKGRASAMNESYRNLFK